MKKFYEVKAKCGHVGRWHYYEATFFVADQSASMAAQAVKKMGRVKRDHGDAILSVQEIALEEYLLGRQAMREDAYLNCKTKSEQKAQWHCIQQNVKPETERQILYRAMYTKFKQKLNKEKSVKQKNSIKNPKKYFMYNRRNDYDYKEQIKYAV